MSCSKERLKQFLSNGDFVCVAELRCKVVGNAEAFRFLQCDPEIESQFRYYFDSGMTPSAAKIPRDTIMYRYLRSTIIDQRDIL